MPGKKSLIPTKLLLVDDDEVTRLVLAKVLEANGFLVTTASTVNDALQHIGSKREKFDVLLSDLQMPDAGDGLTVVSAMRHSNPKAITLILSAFPDVESGAHAILLQTDEILVKSIDLMDLVDVIRQRLAAGPARKRRVETVAQILKRTATSTIEAWYKRTEVEIKLTVVPLSHKERCAHLPEVFRDLERRLLSPEKELYQELDCPAAVRHGRLRREQGYSAAMMVVESRILQVCIFQSLQDNLGSIDFSSVLTEVMTIADEVDSQLSQSMESYIAESLIDKLPA
jgi:DNA-binding response OmpR family regulator